MSTLLSSKLEHLSAINSSLSPHNPSTLRQVPHIANEAAQLLALVQQQIHQLNQRNQQPTEQWCTTLFTCCQILVDVSITGFLPASVGPVLQLLLHIQTLLPTRVDDVVPLSSAFQHLAAHLHAVDVHQHSSQLKQPYSSFWNPTTRLHLSTSFTLPHETDYWNALHLNCRPWSLPTLSNTAIAFPDYLSRLYSTCKASRTSRVVPDVQHALVHGSPNAYSILEMYDVSRQHVTPRRVVHGSSRWSIDVVLVVQRCEEEESRRTTCSPDDDLYQPAMVYVPPHIHSKHSNENDLPQNMDIDVDSTVPEMDENRMEQDEEGEEEQVDWRRLQEESGGGMGYGLLIWSAMSACDHLRGLSIRSYEPVEDPFASTSATTSTTNGNTSAMKVFAKVTEAFVLWWESVKKKEMPTTLYLMDPRTCGTDAVLRVLEGIAVQGAKEERHDSRSSRSGSTSHPSGPQLHLAVPTWLEHASTGTPSTMLPLFDPMWKQRRYCLLGMCENLPLLLQHLLPPQQHSLYQVHSAGKEMVFQKKQQQHDNNHHAPVQAITFNTEAKNDTWLTKTRPYFMQQLAVLSSIMMPLTLVVGPPGTGKTDTVGWSLVALCENVCRRRHKIVIITAHSNKALDQIILRLLELYTTADKDVEEDRTSSATQSSSSSWSPMIVRMGHAESMNDTVRQQCSMKAWISSASSSSSRRPSRQDILANANVIAMTVAGACLRRFSFRNDRIVGAMVMEEAAKMTQPEAVAVLSYRPERVVMVGDPLQLSPVIHNKEIRQRTRLDVSLFERLMSHTAPIVLNQQGRAVPELCDLYRWRYPGLSDLPTVLHNNASTLNYQPCRPRLDFIDVPSGTTREEICVAEGCVVMKFAQFLIHVCHIEPTAISVLTPYRAQRSYLSTLCKPLNVGHVATVDEFQGLQNEIIIVSLVHRGQSGPSEFMNSSRRLNVMTSRGKKSTYLVGRKVTYEQGSEDWKHILQIVQTYQATLPTTVLKWWRNGLQQHCGVQETYLPNSLVQVNETAFMETSSVVQQFPNALVQVNETAFMETNSAVQQVPNSLVQVNEFAFMETNSVVQPNSVEQIKMTGEGAVTSQAAPIKDLYNVSNSVHCRIVGSNIAETMQWSSSTILRIRDYILNKMDLLSEQKVNAFVFDTKDSVFALMIQAAAKKLGQEV